VALPLHDRMTWAWVVLDHEGAVLLLATGPGAFAEAQEWAARGYPIAEISLDPAD